MGLFDRPPGDDRFAPPPGSTDPSPEPTGPSTARRIVSVIVLLPLLRIAVEHYGGHTWWAAAGMLAILWGEFFTYRRRRGQRGPYAPDTHVTR